MTFIRYLPWLPLCAAIRYTGLEGYHQFNEHYKASNDGAGITPSEYTECLEGGGSNQLQKLLNEYRYVNNISGYKSILAPSKSERIVLHKAKTSYNNKLKLIGDDMIQELSKNVTKLEVTLDNDGVPISRIFRADWVNDEYVYFDMEATKKFAKSLYSNLPKQIQINTANYFYKEAKRRYSSDIIQKADNLFKETNITCEDLDEENYKHYMSVINAKNQSTSSSIGDYIGKITEPFQMFMLYLAVGTLCLMSYIAEKFE